ncbi:hypothetical protein IRZ83_07610 [Flavobacterium sp. JLP]|uniref:hypothetical protein n=1 Tax=unclassified Flavobacterium TaxID=196869 RepID=UPI000B06E373|nr:MULTISPECIES: hypothetical protein [unclassified Flavobacterium]MBF4492190.1 hypothetical protein [Flavobacterium sp. MR2016-29]MBF4506533.1 hypothetical protein [Flavobacterium sp. JLP]
MLKKILKLKGTEELSRKQQQTIKGGIACSATVPCKAGFHCVILDGDEGYCKVN